MDFQTLSRDHAKSFQRARLQLHKLLVYHGDLREENVFFLQQTDRPRVIIDFGSSKLVASCTTRHHRGGRVNISSIERFSGYLDESIELDPEQESAEATTSISNYTTYEPSSSSSVNCNQTLNNSR